jgi:hypothetical protein
MIYLSDVEAGGRTVFPTIGVSVPPEAGSALFWFNLDSGSDKYKCSFVFLRLVFGGKIEFKGQ